MTIFNVFSSTRAVPFTNERVKIPIPHRIGSFYSYNLQRYIIDDKLKRIKTLTDEYFFHEYNLKSDIYATEHEEYKVAIEILENLESNKATILKTGKIEGVNIQRRVIQRKKCYSNYLKIITKFIPDDFINEIKQEWIENIYRLSLRSFKFMKKDYVRISLLF